LRAEAAVGRVVEDVALEGALGFEVEAGVAEAAGEGLGIGDAELDFDFGGHGFRVQGTGRREEGGGSREGVRGSGKVGRV
jgi:hypothetical protein